MPSTPDPTLTLPERVTALEGDVASLAKGIARFQRDSPAPVWAWLSTDDPDSARTILSDLVEWVHAVWLAWPDATLPSCWMDHPYVVEELWTLRNAWAAHEKRGGTWGQRLDWIERYRPAAAKRIAGYFSTHRHDDPESDRSVLPSLSAIDAAAARHCSMSPISAPPSPSVTS